MADPELPAFPRLADGVELVYGPDDCIQLRGVTPPVRLTGGLASKLLPLLDGNCGLPMILAKLNDWPGGEVVRALKLLSARGLIDNGRPAGPDPAMAQKVFYWLASPGPANRGDEVLEVLARARIRLFGWGSLAGAVADMLRTCGSLGLAAEFWAPPPDVVTAAPSVSDLPFPEPPGLAQRIPGKSEADLVLLALPRPAPALAAAVNMACVASGVPFLPVVINGAEATVGPTVIGGRSPCHHCFKLRLLSNTPFPADDIAYESALDRPPGRVSLAEWHPFTTAVAGWAALEAIRLVTRFVPPTTLGQVWFLNALSGQCEAARVWKIPRCPVCSRAGVPGEGGDSGEERRRPEPNC